MVYGFARSIPFALIIAITTLISIALSPEKKRLPMFGVVVCVFLFDAWMTLTSITSVFPSLAWPYWELVMKIQLMVLLTMIVMQSKERITALVWVATLSIAFFGVKGGFWTIVRAGNVMIEGPGTGFLSGNNAIAVGFTMTMPLMYWLYTQSQSRAPWIRYALIVSMGLVAIATLGTFSRGGLLAAAGMATWLLVKSRKKMMVIVLIVLLVPIAASMMPDEWFARMGTIRTYEQDTSALARINAWRFAWNVALTHPIVGGGFQVFQPEAFAVWGGDATEFGLRSDEWHDAHSIWFKVLAEQGFVGLGLYALIWILGWRTASRITRETKSRPELRWAGDLAGMIQVSMVAYFVGGSFLSFAYWDFPLTLVAALVATRVVVERGAITDPRHALEADPAARPRTAGRDATAGRASREAYPRSRVTREP